ncbi:MAG: hypothetical protein HOJ57_01770 [Lentisphaerae bacterium]|jgi:hypothetical protein|nr:hypothetical protein [Lentisphaerota bacterium]MBT5604636.1 hypothetical protein [Lentisphaerota bacterium]
MDVEELTKHSAARIFARYGLRYELDDKGWGCVHYEEDVQGERRTGSISFPWGPDGRQAPVSIDLRKALKTISKEFYKDYRPRKAPAITTKMLYRAKFWAEFSAADLCRVEKAVASGKRLAHKREANAQRDAHLQAKDAPVAKGTEVPKD